MVAREAINSVIGKRLRDSRLNAKLTLDEAGKLVGLSGSVVRRYEIGTIKSVSIDIIEKFSSAYDVSEASLMGWDSSIKSNDSLTLTLQEENMVKKYRCLTPEGKETVDTILDLQYKAVAPKVKSETAG